MQCLKMIRVYHKSKFVKVLNGKTGFIEPGGYNMVPCGKCAFCLTNKRSQWMFRVHHEMRTQLHPGYFLTLTYDEKHVRRVGPKGQLSLRFRDVQLFLKRIRKNKYYAKYICVGEYGSDTQRPHYHMLLWTDAPVSFLEENWKSSIDNSRMGAIHFGKLTVASAMYTLKYIIQPKVKTSDDDPREKTRAQFSKGLGLSYLTTEMYEWHTFDYDAPEMFSVINGNKVALPRYYKNKIFTKFQMKKQQSKFYWESVRKHRKAMRHALKIGVKDTKTYFKKLRNDQALMILKKTKYNLSL